MPEPSWRTIPIIGNSVAGISANPASSKDSPFAKGLLGPRRLETPLALRFNQPTVHLMPTLRQSKPTARRTRARKKTITQSKRPFKVELTDEDIALDNAISAAVARRLAFRRSC